MPLCHLGETPKPFLASSSRELARPVDGEMALSPVPSGACPEAKAGRRRSGPEIDEQSRARSAGQVMRWNKQLGAVSGLFAFGRNI